MKRTAVELPVQTQAPAEEEERGPDVDDYVPGEDLEDVIAPLPDAELPDREIVPEPADTTTLISTEISTPSPPPPVVQVDEGSAEELPSDEELTTEPLAQPLPLDVELTTEPLAETLPSDREPTAVPPVEAVSTEEVGVPTSREPAEGVPEKPPAPAAGLRRPVPLVSPSPLPAAPRLVARLSAERRRKSEPPVRSLIRGRIETPHRPVGRQSETAPPSPTTVMRQPLPEGEGMDADLDTVVEESDLPAHDAASPVLRSGEREEIPAGPPRPASADVGPSSRDVVPPVMRRGEGREIAARSLRAEPDRVDKVGAPHPEGEAEPPPRGPDFEDVPVPSPPPDAPLPSVGPRREAPDTFRANDDYAPAAPKEPAGSPRPTGSAPPLISRERLTRRVQTKPADSSPEDLLDPALIWSAATTRELPLARTADSETVSPIRSGPGEAPQVAAEARPGGRLETVLAGWARPQAMAPAAPIISRQAEPGADTGGGEGAETASAEEGAEGEEAVDLDKMAREVYRILHRRLRVEQERARGWLG